MCSSMCSVQAPQQQSSGLEKQSMEVEADWEGRQETGSEASDSRSPSPCIPQRMLVCVDMLLQATERALCCALLLVVMTATADQPKSAGTISHVAAVCRIFWLLPLSPHAGRKCIASAFSCISWYQSISLQLHLLPLLKTLTQMVPNKLNTQLHHPQ